MNNENLVDSDNSDNNNDHNDHVLMGRNYSSILDYITKTMATRGVAVLTCVEKSRDMDYCYEMDRYLMHTAVKNTCDDNHLVYSYSRKLNKKRVLHVYTVGVETSMKFWECPSMRLCKDDGDEEVVCILVD